MLSNYQRIKYEYERSQGDFSALFSEIMQVTDEIGLDKALAILESCVIGKRLAWLTTNLAEVSPTDKPIMVGYQIFYEEYLGVSVPADGEIVERSNDKIVTRWWNACPTLEACEKIGLDTRVICKKAYHRPVGKFLEQIHPRLRFDRNYDCIRPHASFCEEIIYLEGG